MLYIDIRDRREDSDRRANRDRRAARDRRQNKDRRVAVIAVVTDRREAPRRQERNRRSGYAHAILALTYQDA